VVGVLEKSDERVLGDIPVTARLPMGFERMRLYFTDRRIIVGHLGKVGAGSVAPTFLLGSIGSALGGLFGRGKRPQSGSKSEFPSPGRILNSHRDNFSIAFEEIISVDITRGPYKNTISILTKNDKFDLTSPSRIEVLKSLFENAVTNKVRMHETN